MKAAIRGGHIANGRNVTIFSQWTAFCSHLQIDHLLEDEIPPYTDILQVYGHRVRHSHYSYRSKLLRANSVATVWSAIAKTHLLEGRHDPRKP